MKHSENITISGAELRRLIMREYGNVSEADRIQYKGMEITPSDRDPRVSIFYDSQITVTFERNK